MADLPSGGWAHPPRLPHREGGEVVVEHEPFQPLFHHQIHDLGIAPGGPQGTGAQGLGLPPGEQGRTVHPGQDPHLDGDGAKLIGPAAVHPLAQLQDRPAGELPVHVVERGFGQSQDAFPFALRVAFRHLLGRLGGHGFRQPLPRLLVGCSL